MQVFMQVDIFILPFRVKMYAGIHASGYIHITFSSEDVCRYSCKWIYSWYCTQQFFVPWGNVLSVPFSASNGVRQGGILSPILFNLYMNDISNTLNSS